MIPSKPRYDGTDRAWLVSINDARYPVGRDANWYVRAFSQWAVQMRYCSTVKEREVTEDINYDIPPMKPLSVNTICYFNLTSINLREYSMQ